jgi:hypothetical protein
LVTGSESPAGLEPEQFLWQRNTIGIYLIAVTRKIRQAATRVSGPA